MKSLIRVPMYWGDERIGKSTYEVKGGKDR